MISGVLTVNANGLVFLYIVAANLTSQQAAAFALDVVASTHLNIQVSYQSTCHYVEQNYYRNRKEAIKNSEIANALTQLLFLEFI